MVDEETPLTGSTIGSAKVLKMNLERIRFWGLLGGAALLLTGKFVTTYAVVFPAKDPSETSSFWDKLFNGAPSDFEPEETFIFKLFHFNHTCTQLDFNPSKTVAALIIMLHTIPVNIFVVCHYFRVQSHTDAAFANLKKYSMFATPLQFIFFAYFYLVFVNSPDGKFGTKNGMDRFILHYIPYMCWQLGMLLMAIQQCWYISLKRMVPAPFNAFVTPEMMYRYCQMLGVVFVIYTYFCWSFIAGNPAWDTTKGKFGHTAAIFLMYFWDFAAVIVPTIFAGFESLDGDDFCIVFQELQ